MAVVRSEPGQGPHSLESARVKLGGRAVGPSAHPPGTLVAARLRDGERHHGILLWEAGGMCDVWFDDGLARRARSEVVFPVEGPMPEPLLRIACEVRMFSTFAEGTRVRWERETGLEEGRVLEKCRYGAIVAARGGKVIAVGFRKLWPTTIPCLA
jgi:hypothetical protein